MNVSPKARWVLVGVVAILVTVVAAIPWYAGRLLAHRLHDFALRHTQGELVVRNLVHAQGWLSSSGALDLEWRSQCDASGTGPTIVHVAYNASHLPTPQGWSKLQWSAIVDGTPTPGLATQQSPALSGHGAIDYQGQLSTDMQLPALTWSNTDNTLDAQASAGTLRLSDRNLQLTWTLPQIQMQSQDGTFELKDLQLALDVQGRNTRSGTVAIDVGYARWDALIMEGMHLSSQAAERGDRMDSKMVQSVKRVAFREHVLNDWVLELDIKDVHTQSAQTITSLMSKSCGLDNIDAQDQHALRSAIKQLLTSGVIFGIPKLHGSGKDGSVQGQLELTVVAAQGAGGVSLANQLSARGSLRLQGEVLPADQRQMALDSGFVQVVADGLLADFSYGAGVLIVSGVPRDSSLVQLVLQKVDGGLQAFLEDEHAADAGPAEPLVPPSEAPAADATLQAVPRPPPAAQPAAPVSASGVDPKT